MEADIKFNKLRDKLKESNKKIEYKRAYVVDILKKLESSGHTINNINKEQDNEREKEKQWEDKIEKIKRKSENQLSQMVQEVQKVSKSIETSQNNLFELNEKRNQSS